MSDEEDAAKKEEQKPADSQVDDDDPWAMFREHVRFMTLEEIDSRYKYIGILSQNRNATVRLSIHNRTGEKVIMKILNKTTMSDPKKRLLLYREIVTLRLLGDQKHITELYEVLDTGDRIWVVMEYAAGGELFDFVKAKAPLVESQARDIFRPIVKVVEFMHIRHLVHRDLKLENVLLDTNGRILLADFGFSRIYEPEKGLVDSLCGTPHYSPPEIIQGIPHDPSYVDSWSLGVILFMLFFGRFPFNGLSIPELLQSIMKAELVLPFPLSDLATDLISHLITANPKDRFSTAEIIQHPWFNKNHIPHTVKKVDHRERMHAAVMKDMGLQDDIKSNELDKLSEDDMVSYKIFHRRYQIGIIPLPPITNAPHLNALNVKDFPKLIPYPSTRRNPHLPANTAGDKHFPLGMDSAHVREKLYDQNFLTISMMKIPHHPSSSLAMQRKAAKQNKIIEPIARRNARKKERPQTSNNETGKLNIRRLQTMRLRSIGREDPPLPRLNCQHTTLDPVDDLWKRLIIFLEKEQNISIITEQDFGLYLLISEPHELYVSLNIGCVHPGFGLIGFSLYKIRGDENEFREDRKSVV